MASVKAFGAFCVGLLLSTLHGSESVPSVREKRSDDPQALQAVIDNLAQQLNTVKAELATHQNQLTAHQARLDAHDKVVAFHAYGSGSTVNTTPYGTVILSGTRTNIGNAYDPQTGFFTAPVSGLYFFHATFMNRDMNDYIHGEIRVDNTIVALSIADSRHGYYDNPAISAVVHVNAGHKVQLRSEDNAVNHYYSGLYTTFTGFLIHQDA